MSPKKLVDDIDHLVSLPDVCVKVNRLVESPDYSAAAVGKIVAQDTDLSARLLRLVNSSFFGLQSQVETISRAIALIGSYELRNLVMATTAVKSFTGIPGDLVDMAEFWRFSILTGVIGRELAFRCNVLHSERLFVMGMLHDIGRLVIYLTLAEQSRDILLITGGDDWLLPDTERDVLGFTHMEVGAELLNRWKLSESLKTVVGTHHTPDKAGDYRFEASLLNCAVTLSNGEMAGKSMDEMLNTIAPPVLELTGLTLEDLTCVSAEAPAKAAEVMDLVVGQAARSEHLDSLRLR